MKIISKLWNKIIDIGVQENFTRMQSKYIRLTNGITLITILMGFNFYPNLIRFLPDTKIFLILLSSSLLSYSFTFVLNYFKLYLPAKNFLLFNALVCLSIPSVLLGREQNFHLYLLSVVAVSYFIYESHEKIYQNLLTAIVSITYMGLEFWFAFHKKGILDLPEEFLFYAGINNNLGLIFFILGFLYYISSRYRRMEKELEQEKKISEDLLHNILPVPIADRLRESKQIIADGFPVVTMLFADIVGFTPLSEKKSPDELVAILNKIFSEFDKLTDKFGLEKIKTIGDAFMVAGGLPIPSENHAFMVAELALEMREVLEKINKEEIENLNIRIGIHTGPVVAGVIGISKFSYDVWGNTVNTASRMESHSLPGKIQVSEDTYEFIKDNYEFTERGMIEIKGKGIMKTYFLERKIY